MLMQPRGHHARHAADEPDLGAGALPVGVPQASSGQMQHDLFHVYTVDQHILMVLRNVRRFFIAEHAHEYPFCSQLAAGWDKPYILYIAALFHDIAKGRGGDHSELGAREVRLFCRQHDIERRGLQADRVPGARAPGHEPHRAEGGPERPGRDRRVRQARGQRALPHGAVPADGGRHPRHQPQGVERLEGQAAGGPVPLHAARAGRPRARPATPRSRRASARRWCSWRCTPCPSRRTRSCGTRWTWAISCATTPATSPGTPGTCRATSGKRARPIVRARLSPVGEGLQVLVYTPDQPDLFARICGYFDQAGFSILDAKVHTANNGYALDTFQVVTLDAARAQPRADQHGRVGAGSTPSQQAGPLPPPSRGRVSRRVKSFPIAPRVDLRARREGPALAAVASRPATASACSIRWRACWRSHQHQPAAGQGHDAGRAGGRHLPDRRPGAAAEPARRSRSRPSCWKRWPRLIRGRCQLRQYRARQNSSSRRAASSRRYS